MSEQGCDHTFVVRLADGTVPADFEIGCRDCTVGLQVELERLRQRVAELTGPFPDATSNWTKDQWKQLAMLARHRAETAEARVAEVEGELLAAKLRSADNQNAYYREKGERERLAAALQEAQRELNNIREKRCTCPHDYYHGDHHYTYCPASDKSKAASSHLMFPLNRVAYALEAPERAALTANQEARDA